MERTSETREGVQGLRDWGRRHASHVGTFRPRFPLDDPYASSHWCASTRAGHHSSSDADRVDGAQKRVRLFCCSDFFLCIAISLTQLDTRSPRLSGFTPTRAPPEAATSSRWLGRILRMSGTSPASSWNAKLTPRAWRPDSSRTTLWSARPRRTERAGYTWNSR